MMLITVKTMKVETTSLVTVVVAVFWKRPLPLSARLPWSLHRPLKPRPELR
jgi:hypothetical protein